MKFYIVTPSYNQAHFIQKTIDSVLSQEGKFTVQYCVMDGGSTDDTKKILKKLPKFVHWVSEKDKGQTDAINKGIKYFSQLKNLDAKNTIFAYINSDDFYMPETFQRVMAEFTQHPETDWVVGDAVIVDAKNQEIQKAVRFYKQMWRKLFSFFTLSVLNPIPQPSTFIRWSAVKQIGPFNVDLRYVMDYEYWFRLLQAGKKPRFIAQAFSSFRIHGDSKGGSQFEKQFAQELEVTRRYTNNTLALMLHKIHNAMIVGIYKILK